MCMVIFQGSHNFKNQWITNNKKDQNKTRKISIEIDYI